MAPSSFATDITIHPSSVVHNDMVSTALHSSRFLQSGL